MKKYWKMVFFGISFIASQAALACPDNHDRVCVIPKPFGGCAQYACVPRVEDPIEAITRAINKKALELAIDGKESEVIQDRQDCVVIVTTGLAIWGTSVGGPWAGLASGAVGASAASIACRKTFPLE